MWFFDCSCIRMLLQQEKKNPQKQANKNKTKYMHKRCAEEAFAAWFDIVKTFESCNIVWILPCSKSSLYSSRNFSPPIGCLIKLKQCLQIQNPILIKNNYILIPIIFSNVLYFVTVDATNLQRDVSRCHLLGY